MREQHYQSTMSNNLVNGRIKPTQPPVAPAEYYSTMTNRLNAGRFLLLLLLIEI